MKRLLPSLILICLLPAAAYAREDEEQKPSPDAALMKLVAETPGLSIDTTFIKKYRKINDYSMLGVQYGVNIASASMNPTREVSSVFRPLDIGILYTRYCKMFGYMPYFGFQTGVFYSEQAYRFTEDEESGLPSFSLLGAYGLKTSVIEVPFTAQMHVDFWKMKLLVDITFYAGYRLSIERFYDDRICRPDDYRREWAASFHPNERKFFYGLQGAGGVGFIFDPFEIHFMAGYRYDLSYMYKPNISTSTFVEGENRSKYYYTWANPTNIVISVGVHYQLTRRIGSTHRQLREEARRQIEEELMLERHEGRMQVNPSSEMKKTGVKNNRNRKNGKIATIEDESDNSESR